MTFRARRIVVVGNGMVGARFVEEVLRRDPAGERVRVTVVGAERGPAYNRVLLPGVIAGDYTPEEIALPHVDAPWITVRGGTVAVAIDRRRRRVRVDCGTELEYDELVLATGARASFPPVAGVTASTGGPDEGVTAVRDLHDCRRVAALVRPGVPVAVLGGGVLGLEVARALNRLGARVHLVESAPRLMPRQLDQAAARLLARRYAALGVRTHIQRTASRWVPGTGLELDDGRTVAADALVVATGVRSDTGLAEAAGITVERGVVVDDTLTTSDPRVYAIGDCAQHPGGGDGLIQTGWEQAAVLADLLTGAAPHARYTGARPITRLKAEGIDLVSFGEGAARGTENVTVNDARGGRYAKVSLRGDRVIGAVLFGFPNAAAVIGQLYDRGAAAPADLLALLVGTAPSGAVDPAAALVCHCNAVTRTQLESAWWDGARTCQALAAATRATTGCGGCSDDVGALLKEWASGSPR